MIPLTTHLFSHWSIPLRFATGVNDTGGKWKKSSIRKILIILFGHVWVVEETYM
jgi:hypothetical protein